MTNPNFQSILQKPIEEIKAPSPMPIGSYLCRVTKFEFGESRDKKTPFVMYTLVPYQAEEDVDRALLEAIEGLEGKELRLTFYITEDAAFRLREFLENDVEVAGTNLEAMIPQASGQPVGVYVGQRVDKDTGKVYSEIKKTFKVS